MPPAAGRLEARITVPTAGYSFDVTDDSGAATLTIPAGTYYMTDSNHSSGGQSLRAKMNSVLNAHDSSWDCDINAVEGASHLITIDNSGAVHTLTWTNTTLRDLLGFAANLSGAPPYVGTKQPKSIWLPSCPPMQDFADHDPTTPAGVWAGWHEFDMRSTESMLGHGRHIMGQRRRVRSQRWAAVTAARTWIADEALANESFEQWAKDSIYADQSWATVGGPIVYIPNADLGVTAVAEYYVESLADLKHARFTESWTGRWSIELPRLVTGS